MVLRKNSPPDETPGEPLSRKSPLAVGRERTARSRGLRPLRSRLGTRLHLVRAVIAPRRPRQERSSSRAGRTRLGCSPRASARGSPWWMARRSCRNRSLSRPAAASLAARNPLASCQSGQSPSGAASGTVELACRANSAGMQPSRKREGKPVVEGAAAVSEPLALAACGRFARGSEPARILSERSQPLGGRVRNGRARVPGEHGWDAALAQARGEARGGGGGGRVGTARSRGSVPAMSSRESSFVLMSWRVRGAHSKIARVATPGGRRRGRALRLRCRGFSGRDSAGLRTRSSLSPCGWQAG
jgi:hypothetical protein